MAINGGNVEAASNLNEVTATSTWTWYYTDYKLVDGWYEMWYINHATETRKKTIMLS